MTSTPVAGKFYPDIRSAQPDLSPLAHKPAAVRYWADGLITDVRTGYYRGKGLVHIPDGSPMRTMKDPPWTTINPYEMTTPGQWSGCDAMYRIPEDNPWYFERLLRKDDQPLVHNIDLGLCAGVSIYETPNGAYPVIEVVDFKTDLVRGFPRPDMPGMTHVKDAEEFEPALTTNVVAIAGHPAVTEIPTELAGDIRDARHVLERRAEAALYFRNKGGDTSPDLEPFTDSILDRSVADMFISTPPVSGKSQPRKRWAKFLKLLVSQMLPRRLRSSDSFAEDVPEFTMGALPGDGAPTITWKELTQRRPPLPALPALLPNETTAKNPTLVHLGSALPAPLLSHRATNPTPVHLNPARRQ